LHVVRLVSLLSFALVLAGCQHAKLAGTPLEIPAATSQRTVVIEPFFESAQWQTNYKTEYAQVMNPYGSGGFGYGGMGMGPNSTVAIQRAVTDKTVFARVGALAEEHRQLLAALAKARPTWRVTSTSGANALSGPVTVVRIIVHDSELVESNRTLKNLAFAFGLLIWPLELIVISPVEETQRVWGTLDRYETEGGELRGRLVRYPTQPDFAVNTNGLTALEHKFGLDIPYTEGLLANEAPRDGVLIEGFVQKLTAAVVAIVEEPPQQSTPSPAPAPAPAPSVAP
jgi:hypothetical protein